MIAWSGRLPPDRKMDRPPTLPFSCGAEKKLAACRDPGYNGCF
jgi:hypothetical protein